jgi:hypothetical protein
MTTMHLKEMAPMRTRRSSPRAARLWLAALGVAAALALLAPAAGADSFGIQSLTTTVTSAQAGGHPDLTTTVMFNTQGGTLLGRDKGLEVSLPPGLLGDPQAVPECPMSDLLADGGCEPASQVGLLTLFLLTDPSQPPFPQPLPIYRVPAQPGHAASFAAIVLVPTVLLNADIDPEGGYRLTTTLKDASAGLPLAGSQLEFWGVPADPSHDAERFFAPPNVTPGAPAGVPPRPFMIYPSDCSSGNLVTTARANSYEDPGTFSTATSVMTIDPAIDPSAPAADPAGCEKLSIAPWLQVAPSDPQADSPSGYEVNLHVPQDDAPYGLATPPLRDVSVTLPQGVSLSPAAADGLAACADAQFAATSNTEVACPDASKIGSVEIDSPLQPDPLEGAIFLGRPEPGNPYRIFVSAAGPGTLIKLIGRVTADPGTGQLTTAFDDAPQLPFSSFKLRFFGGARAALANPQTCGNLLATSAATAWSGGATARPGAAFDITGCSSSPVFAPGFLAGTTNNHAGESTSFTLQARRADGQAGLASVSADLPPGLIANVASVQPCGEADANAGTCPDASQVGSADIASGAGGHPFWLHGRTFLTGPYNGAPFGLAIVVPAVAGPLDLGTVVVRAAVDVDPVDAHLRVSSDPLPQMLQGIPLRLRTVAVTVDRPGFILNPTSCRPLSVSGTIGSTSGTTAVVSSPFQVARCDRVAFKPHVAARFTGGGTQTRRGAHPGLAVTLTQSPGQAAARSVALTLPSSVALDAGRLSLCARDRWLAGDCPAESKVGSAKALTPILSQPLSGPVYLVNGPGLPMLGVRLDGQVRLRLEAQTAVVGKRIRTTFASLPDVPLRSFALTFQGGRRGILKPNASLCPRRQLAALRLVGQNGVTRRSTLAIGRSCKR